MPRRWMPFLILILIVLLPILFLDVVTTAVIKLGIAPDWAPWIVLLILIGSFINLPVFRETVNQTLSRHPLDIWGAQRYWPQWKKQRRERVIAVNVGGFVVPMLLVLFELQRIWYYQADALPALFVCISLNIALCYFSARPVANVGIVMNAFLPGLVAALSALFLAPSIAPPVAFCAGVLGPVVGADLLHLREIRRMSVGVASIGGAGTFDGIVISGLLAVLLA